MKYKTAKLAMCIKNAEYEGDLYLHKAYKMLPDPKAEVHGMIRVVDESGEDYLYPRNWFRPIRVSAWRQAGPAGKHANGRNGGPRVRKPASRTRRTLAAREA